MGTGNKTSQALSASAVATGNKASQALRGSAVGRVIAQDTSPVEAAAPVPVPGDRAHRLRVLLDWCGSGR